MHCPCPSSLQLLPWQYLPLSFYFFDKSIFFSLPFHSRVLLVCVCQKVYDITNECKLLSFLIWSPDLQNLSSVKHSVSQSLLFMGNSKHKWAKLHSNTAARNSLLCSIPDKTKSPDRISLCSDLDPKPKHILFYLLIKATLLTAHWVEHRQVEIWPHLFLLQPCALRFLWKLNHVHSSGPFTSGAYTWYNAYGYISITYVLTER